MRAPLDKKRKIDEKFLCGWHTAPDDIMQQIIRHLSIWDRIKLRKVCQSWRSLSIRKDIPTSPTEMPWLLLHHPSPISKSNKSISFYSLTDSKVHKFPMPWGFQTGGWLHSTTKGWLVMVKNNYNGMVLLDPISGAKRKLPSLESVFPDFLSFRACLGGFEFCDKVALSTSDIESEDCIVAASFLGRNLTLCKVGDERWTTVLTLDGSDSSRLLDLVFSSCGKKLYGLTSSTDRDYNNYNRTVVIGQHKMEVMIFGNILPPHPNGCTGRWFFRSHLLESDNEVFLFHNIQDANRELLKIIAYNVDVETGKLHEVKQFGNKTMFVSEWGCSSLMASKGNCIYSVAFNQNRSNFSTGIFYPETETFEHIPRMDISVLLHLHKENPYVNHTNDGSCWFTPKLY